MPSSRTLDIAAGILSQSNKDARLSGIEWFFILFCIILMRFSSSQLQIGSSVKSSTSVEDKLQISDLVQGIYLLRRISGA